MESGRFTEEEVLSLAKDAYQHGSANFDITAGI